MTTKAKLLVTEEKGGTRVALLGSTGKPLLTSPVFSEPRAKGATIRSLAHLMPDVMVDDQTTARARTTPPTSTARLTTRRTPTMGAGRNRRRT